MWPFLKGGEKLLIKKTPLEKLIVGDIVMYQANSQLVCHRLIRKVRKAQGYILYVRGDNSISHPETVEGGMFLGKAIGIIRGGRIVNLEHINWKIINRIIVLAAPLVNLVIRVYNYSRRWNPDGR